MIPKLHKDFIDRAIKILKTDSRLVGIAIGGSYITNEMDEYSDVDLIIAIDDASYNEIMNERYAIADKLGHLLSAFTGEHVGEPRLLICLYGPECLHVDLKFVALKDIAKRVEEPCVLWERNECISEALKKDEAKFPVPSLQWIEDRFWVWVHYGAIKIGRGEIFESIEFISFLRQTVLGPLILMKHGELPKGIRKIEFLAPDYANILKATVPLYSAKSCIESLNLVIRLYLELRESFLTVDFVKRKEAEVYSMDYLSKVSQKIKVVD